MTPARIKLIPTCLSCSPENWHIALYCYSRYKYKRSTLMWSIRWCEARADEFSQTKSHLKIRYVFFHQLDLHRAFGFLVEYRFCRPHWIRRCNVSFARLRVAINIHGWVDSCLRDADLFCSRIQNTSHQSHVSRTLRLDRPLVNPTVLLVHRYHLLRVRTRAS